MSADVGHCAPDEFVRDAVVDRELIFPPSSVRWDRSPAMAELGWPARVRGRLIFALDATGSRQPTWDLACQLQADIFSRAAACCPSTCSSSWTRRS